MTLQIHRVTPSTPTTIIIFVETLLAKVCRTSTGNDGIPYWVFRDCAADLAEVVAEDANFSLYLVQLFLNFFNYPTNE